MQVLRQLFWKGYNANLGRGKEKKITIYDGKGAGPSRASSRSYPLLCGKLGAHQTFGSRVGTAYLRLAIIDLVMDTALIFRTGGKALRYLRRGHQPEHGAMAFGSLRLEARSEM